MALRVVGAGVGRTGTNSLKLALEHLLRAPCHHMFEIRNDRSQIPDWTAAIEGRPVDWGAMLADYAALVDWPGASFWPELSRTNPDALVLLSVRDPKSWYESASKTIFPVLAEPPAEMGPWMETLRMLLRNRFSDRLDDEGAMTAAFERHNDAVRRAIAPERLLEWSPDEGWEPICGRLGLDVPVEAFPKTNSAAEFNAEPETSPQRDPTSGSAE